MAARVNLRVMVSQPIVDELKAAAREEQTTQQEIIERLLLGWLGQRVVLQRSQEAAGEDFATMGDGGGR